MGICQRRKLGFIHIPKNAGTAIAHALPLPEYDGHWSIRRLSRELNLEEFWLFTVVRNPLERAVSNYCYARLPESRWHSIRGRDGLPPHPDYPLLKDASFHNYCALLAHGKLKGLGARPQVSFMKTAAGTLYPFSHIFLQENLQTQFTRVMAWRTGMNLVLPRLNVTTGNFRLADWYDDYAMQTVTRQYREDLALYQRLRWEQGEV